MFEKVVMIKHYLECLIYPLSQNKLKLRRKQRNKIVKIFAKQDRTHVYLKIVKVVIPLFKLNLMNYI